MFIYTCQLDTKIAQSFTWIFISRNIYIFTGIKIQLPQVFQVRQKYKYIKEKIIFV